VKIRDAVAALAMLVLSTGQSVSWDGNGHQVVGSIADQLLSPSAKTHVQNLLGFTLRIAGPWADCVKSVKREADGKYRYVRDDQYKEWCEPFEAPMAPQEQARMENFVERNWLLCKYQEYKSSCDNTYHFTDVPIQKTKYSRRYAGTNDHDIVQAINAAIAKLKDLPLEAPISIGDKREAIFLLAHWIGDLHQPLHVAAVYLDTQGNLIKPPDGSTPKDVNDTQGGNKLVDPNNDFYLGWDCHPPDYFHNFHYEWDCIPKERGDMTATAKKVPRTRGRLEEFAAKWASDTIRVARNKAFRGVSFEPATRGQDGFDRWDVNLPDDYWKLQDETKKAQLAKAGAHLAELFNSIWP
jgi:hypothetical protein